MKCWLFFVLLLMVGLNGWDENWWIRWSGQITQNVERREKDGEIEEWLGDTEGRMRKYRSI